MVSSRPPSATIHPFPVPSASASRPARSLRLDPDDPGSYGPAPLARPREMPYLPLDLHAAQSQLSDTGFEGGFLTIGRRKALGLPVDEIKCKVLPRWVQIALRRQSAQAAEQDVAWVAAEAALDRLVHADEYRLWGEVTRAMHDPAQPLSVDFHNDVAAVFYGQWSFEVDSGGSGTYGRNFRVPAELGAAIGTAAGVIGNPTSHLFLALLLDGLRSAEDAYDRPAMDRAVNSYYRALRKRVRRLVAELKIADDEGEIVLGSRLAVLLFESDKRLRTSSV